MAGQCAPTATTTSVASQLPHDIWDGAQRLPDRNSRERAHTVRDARVHTR
jgi:hypothetical protein